MFDISFFNIISLLFAFIGYFVSFMFYLIAFSHKKEKLATYGTCVAWSALIFHTISIILRGIQIGHFPLTKMYETISFFSLCIVLLFLLTNVFYKLKSSGQTVLGLIVLPMLCIFLGYALLMPKSAEPLPLILKSRMVILHVIVGLLSYASFVIAFVSGIIYLYQDKQIKSKNKNIWHYRLPSLEVIDEVNFRAIIFGYPLFTLTLITGIIWANRTWGSFWNWDPKETSSLIIWAIYSFYLHARIISGWRGRRTAILSIIAFLFVIFTYFGLYYLELGFHTYSS